MQPDPRFLTEPTTLRPTIAYLSGRMTGKPDYGVSEFASVAEFYRKRGLIVDNPAEHFNGDQTLPFDVYLRADVDSVLRADMLLVLDDWRESPGATLEVAIAAAIGTPVYWAMDRIKGRVPEECFPPEIFPESASPRDRLKEVLGL